MAINKNFVVKNGLEINSNLLIANSETNKVGVGSTGPRSTLDVRGGIAGTDINITGVATIAYLPELTAGTGVVTSIGGTNFVYSTGTFLGITTVGGTFIITPDAVGTGGTCGAAVGVITYYGSGANLTDLPSAAAGGSDTQVQFNSSDSFGGSANLVFDNSQLTVGTAVTIDGSGINIHSGIATLEGGVRVGSAASIKANGNASFSGIVTAVSFVGDGTGLTGVASTDNIITTTPADFFGGIVVSGGASFANGITTVAGISSFYNDVRFDGTNYDLWWDQSASILKFTDGCEANFGAGGDLEIYHTGAHSYIKDSGTGELKVAASTLSLENADLDETLATLPQAGRVVVYDANVEAFRTSPGPGVVITGVCTASSGVHVGAGITMSAEIIDGRTTVRILGENLKVAGVVTCQDVNSLSDVTLKENITTVDSALDKVSKIRGVKFDWKESGLPSYGVFAQELEEILPELVHGNDPRTVNYNGIIGVLIEAIKELQEEVNSLKNN